MMASSGCVFFPLLLLLFIILPPPLHPLAQLPLHPRSSPNSSSLAPAALMKGNKSRPARQHNFGPPGPPMGPEGAIGWPTMMDPCCLQGHVHASQVPGMCARTQMMPEQIVAGQPYTLAVGMPVHDQWDYMLDRCTCNQLSPFVGAGCLFRNDQWREMGEIVVDGIKYILIYFVAPDSNLHFECQARVFQCCACCQNACERRSALGPYPSRVLPVSIALPVPPVSLPALPPPAPGGCLLPASASSYCSSGFIFGLPLRLFWPLLILLLFLLALLICCLFSLCLGAFGWRFRKSWASRKKVHPPPPPPLPLPSPVPPPPSPPGRGVFVVDESSQTMPPPPRPIVLPADYGRSETAEQRQRREWETERHAPMPLRELGGGGREWWTVEETIRKEEEEVRTTEWRDEEEEERMRRMMRKKGEGRVAPEERRTRGDQWKEEQKWEEEEEVRRRVEEERRHYENWGWPATDHRYPASTTGWTHFGTEPMAGVAAGEEEDRVHWRRTEPPNGGSGGGGVREGVSRVYRQKSTY